MDFSHFSSLRCLLRLGCIAVVVAAFIWTALAIASPTPEKCVLLVHVDDQEPVVMSLDENTEQVFESEGGYNVVTVRDGSAFVSYADCDGHDCMAQPNADKPGDLIICLPHRFYVEVVSAEEVTS